MTLEELIAREAIRDTIAVTSQAGDHLNVDEYVGCFTPDGVLEYGDALHKAGHEAIRSWFLKAKKHEGKRGLVRHSVTSIAITLDDAPGPPASADVRSYYQVIGDNGLDHFGWYRDRFVPCGGRWLLRHRIVGVEWRSSQSRSVR